MSNLSSQAIEAGRVRSPVCDALHVGLLLELCNETADALDASLHLKYEQPPLVFISAKLLKIAHQLHHTIHRRHQRTTLLAVASQVGNLAEPVEEMGRLGLQGHVVQHEEAIAAIRIALADQSRVVLDGEREFVEPRQSLHAGWWRLSDLLMAAAYYNEITVKPHAALVSIWVHNKIK